MRLIRRSRKDRRPWSWSGHQPHNVPDVDHKPFEVPDVHGEMLLDQGHYMRVPDWYVRTEKGDNLPVVRTPGGRWRVEGQRATHATRSEAVAQLRAIKASKSKRNNRRMKK